MTQAARGRTTWGLAIVGLLLALGLPQLKLGSLLFPGSALPAVLAREGVWWAMAAIVLGWVLLAERLPLSSIGIRRPTWRTWAWGLAYAVVAMATVMLSYAVIFPMLGLKVNAGTVSKIVALPLWAQVFVFVTRGVCEEILYRGYPIERLQALTGSRWIAALVPGIVFVYGHLAGWGAPQLIVVTLGTVVFTLAYFHRRDLVSLMFAHALVDLAGFLAAGAQMK